MLIVVIMACVTVSLLAGQAGAGLGPWPLAGMAVAYAAGAYVLSRLSAMRGLRRLMQAGPTPRKQILLAMLGPFYLLVGLAGLMWLGLGNLLERWPPLGQQPLLGKLLGLLSFTAALVLYWLGSYPLERAWRQKMQAEAVISGGRGLPTWTRRQFLDFQIRHNLLMVLVPVLMIMLLEDLARLAEPHVGPSASLVLQLVTLAATLAVLTTAPIMIVRIWRTRPLAEGPFRQRLVGLCRQMRLRYRDIRLWVTDGVVVNAGVMGLVGPVRYVLLSDALVDNMSPRGVEAVFAHEAGHIVHHHILYTVLFTVGVLGLLSTVVDQAAAVMGLGQDYRQVLALLGSGLAWFWLFGMVSRRFEWQADVHAACQVYDDNGLAGLAEPDTACEQAVPPVPGQDMPANGAGMAPSAGMAPETRSMPAASPGLNLEAVDVFSNALLDVARLNGLSLDQPNFRHGTIRTRINYLWQLLQTDPSLTNFNRRMRRLKLTIWVIFIAGAAAATLAALWE